MDGSTPFLALVKPGIGDEAGEDLWGAKLNANFDALDLNALTLTNLTTALGTDFTDLETAVTSQLSAFDAEMDLEFAAQAASVMTQLTAQNTSVTNQLAAQDAAVAAQFSGQDLAIFDQLAAQDAAILAQLAAQDTAVTAQMTFYTDAILTALTDQELALDVRLDDQAAILANMLDDVTDYGVRLSDAETDIAAAVATVASKINDAPANGFTYGRLNNAWVDVTGGAGVAWAAITGKPATFTPSAHTHVQANITDMTATDISVNTMAHPNGLSITEGIAGSNGYPSFAAYLNVKSPFNPLNRTWSMGMGSDGVFWYRNQHSTAWDAATGINASDTDLTDNWSRWFRVWSEANFDPTTKVNLSGGTMTGKLTAVAGATQGGFAIQVGGTPSLPADGDMWMTAVGLYARVNGVTVGPIGASGATLGANTFTGKQSFPAATTGFASVNIPAGVAPTSPADGDFWSVGSSLFYKVTSGTHQIPFLASTNSWTAKQNFAASTTTTAYFNLAHGVAPTSPVNGDIWTTTGAVNVRLNGGTHSMAFYGASGTWAAKQIFFTSTTAAASITLPHGVAPTSPVNGDMWTTTSGLFLRVNSTTFQMPAVNIAQTWGAKQTFFTPVTGAASIVLPHGVAPTSPVDGDMWTTTGGLFARINGVTQNYVPNVDPTFTGALNIPGWKLGSKSVNLSTTYATVLAVTIPTTNNAANVRITYHGILAAVGAVQFSAEVILVNDGNALGQPGAIVSLFSNQSNGSYIDLQIQDPGAGTTFNIQMRHSALSVTSGFLTFEVRGQFTTVA